MDPLEPISLPYKQEAAGSIPAPPTMIRKELIGLIAFAVPLFLLAKTAGVIA